VPVLNSRLGSWELPAVHAWSERGQVIRAPEQTLITPSTRIATIGSCFAQELAAMMAEVGLNGGMHPGGLFYSTAAIRQELERLVGGWPERAAEPLWQVSGGFVDPFRDYDTVYPDDASLLAARSKVDEPALELFTSANVVVVTLGLIEVWRSRATGNVFRAIPHPAVFRELQPEFSRLTVAEMLDDLERIRTVVRDHIGAELVLTTSPVPLHTTFTELDVRVANTESKSRIRAAVSEFCDRHPEVFYIHSYEMAVTAEKQSDYFKDDGRHLHRHAVRYILSEFLRIYAVPALRLGDVDTSWLTPITKTAALPTPDPKPARARAPQPSRPAWRRATGKVRRTLTRS
jgi:GSCFA family protein